ncbi:CIC11C00000002894 [Sungouiella intermedia]|uniref:CIC11C00000002894 n=1 Tax=Sungouiella intermedia TaxID=45354 RepID=A0A1L0C3B3_9ASCO|nr:CIC11C00000002894 [[Candida] intermedia]
MNFLNTLFYLSVCVYVKSESIDPDLITDVYFNSYLNEYYTTTIHLSGFSLFYANPTVASENNNFYGVSNWSEYSEYYISFVSKYQTELNSLWSANGYTSIDVLSNALSYVSENLPTASESSFDNFINSGSTLYIYITSIPILTTSSSDMQQSDTAGASSPTTSQSSPPTTSQPSPPTTSQPSSPTTSQPSSPATSQPSSSTTSQPSSPSPTTAAPNPLTADSTDKVKTLGKNAGANNQSLKALFVLCSFLFLANLL